jgi:hypothetical protein
MQKKWRAVRKILKRMQRKRNTAGEGDYSMSLIQQRDSTGLCFLSMCFGLEAPLDILFKISDLDPNQAYQLDIYGASAMHIACLNGVSLKCLSSSAMPKSLVSVKDLDGSLPIHLLMVCLGNKEIELESAMDIVDWMIDIDPEIIFTQDNHGYTPVDIVQHLRRKFYDSSKEYKQLKRMYGHLQQAYMKCWRMKKSTWESRNEIIQDPKDLATNDATRFNSREISLEPLLA